MLEKTKNVEVAGQTYRIRRMSPKVGSFILFKVMGALREGMAKRRPAVEEAPSTAPEKNVTPPDVEEFTRVMVVSALFGAGQDFETHSFIQTQALLVCSIVEQGENGEQTFPICNDSGQMANTPAKDDLSVISKLEIESLVFNLASFFGAGGLSGAGI